MHETGCLGLVYWDDPEEWDGFRMGYDIRANEFLSAVLYCFLYVAPCLLSDLLKAISENKP